MKKIKFTPVRIRALVGAVLLITVFIMTEHNFISFFALSLSFLGIIGITSLYGIKLGSGSNLSNSINRNKFETFAKTNISMSQSTDTVRLFQGLGSFENRFRTRGY